LHGGGGTIRQNPPLGSVISHNRRRERGRTVDVNPRVGKVVGLSLRQTDGWTHGRAGGKEDVRLAAWSKRGREGGGTFKQWREGEREGEREYGSPAGGKAGFDAWAPR
jgi:hypothetical protein